MFGNTLDFIKDADNKPILKSLSEKVDTSEESFPKYINDLRLASFLEVHLHNYLVTAIKYYKDH